jgi:ABC-2 type transport system permease protein
MSAAQISGTQRFYWSIRRELWENRSLYLAPLGVAVLIVVASLVGAVHLPERLRDASIAPAARQDLLEQPLTFAALLLMFSTLVVGVFYAVEALQAERRDRSILFWKSLPVSDLMTVAAKASVLIVILPLITWAITVVTQAVMMAIGSVRLAGTDPAMAPVWSHVSLAQMSGGLFVHLLFGHGLWWAPLWGWLLLVSAWARRAAFLWATLPLLAIGLLERIAFNTSYFVSLLLHRFTADAMASGTSGDSMSMASLTMSGPAEFLTAFSFWSGLAVLAIFVAAAARLRRSRGPA